MVEAKVFKNSAIYTVCGFVTKGLNFILLPLYTMYLTTADYGITGLVDNFRNVMVYVAVFSIQAAVMRFYIDYSDDSLRLPRYVGTVMCFAFVSTLAWCLVIMALRHLIMPYVFQGLDFYPTVTIVLVGLMFSNVYGIFQELLKSMENARLAATNSLCYVLLTTTLTIIFIVPLGMGANGVLLASATSALVFCAYAVIYLCRNGLFTFCIDFKILKGVLAYSIPIMPHNLSTSISALVSTVLINNGGSLAAVGIYNLASKFGVVCDTIQSSVSTAYQPWLFRMLHDRPQGFKEQIRSFSETLIWVYALVFVGLGLFIQELIFLFLDSSYREAWMLVPLIIGVYSIKTVYYFYISILFYYKKAARLIFVATLSSSLLNVLLSIPFIALFGAYGSVLADAMAMILRVGIVIAMSCRYEDCGYTIWQFARVTLAVLATLGIGLAFSYLWFPQELSPLNFTWKLVVYGAFIVIVCLTHKSGVKTVAHAVRAKLGRKNNR